MALLTVFVCSDLPYRLRLDAGRLWYGLVGSISSTSLAAAAHTSSGDSAGFVFSPEHESSTPPSAFRRRSIGEAIARPSGWIFFARSGNRPPEYEQPDPWRSDPCDLPPSRPSNQAMVLPPHPCAALLPLLDAQSNPSQIGKVATEPRHGATEPPNRAGQQH